MTQKSEWIGIILAERYGQNFILKFPEDGSIRLMLPGSESFIGISTDSGIFAGAGLDIPCAYWEAAAEGWVSPLGKQLPAPGAEDLRLPLIEKRGADYHIHYNILELVYWMLTRQEEIGRADLDDYGRFPATGSHAFKHGYLTRPIVDEWLYILGQVIQRQWPELKLIQHHFILKVSHDVDQPSRYSFRPAKGVIRAMLGDILRRQNFKSALLGPWIRLCGKTTLHPADSANSFDWIMDISERHGLVSAFYFICGCTDPDKDADYEPEHPAIRELMRRIHRRGHEIGLHPSYNTYQNPLAIASEAMRLKRICEEEGIWQTEWGGRMHYLRWEQPGTMHGWELACMNYDATLGYADQAGFRCGTCFEYPAFDPIEGRILNLRIRPLIAMECTVIEAGYMGLGLGEAALKKFKELKDACRVVGGCFTLLWHNSSLGTENERDLYQSVLSI